MNLEEIAPRETAGSSTQARFSYQQEVIAYFCIQMFENLSIAKIFCDFHSDCAIEYVNGLIHFLQIKGIKNKAYSFADFKKNALKDMFSNYSKVKGKCKCTLITNATLDRNFRDLIRIKEAKQRSQLLSQNDSETLDSLESDCNNIIKENSDLLSKFIAEFEVLSEFPSFSETLVPKTITLTDYNIANLRNVLYDYMGERFSKEDAKNVYALFCQEIYQRSKITTPYDRYLTREYLAEKIQIPPFQRWLFSNVLSSADVQKLRRQSVLEAKLEKGGFSKEFIKNAMYVRAVARCWREKASKLQANRSLIEDFDFKLRNICVDVFEEHSRSASIDSLKMLKNLEGRLTELASGTLYQGKFEPDFARGLIWEATSQCKFRWDNGKK